jgi:glycosyltransferase involved in cell wall biosynthesis
VVTAVASALLQSYAPKEVIVIDDGSRDATVALLQQRFPEPLAEGRLVIVAQENAGVSAARNAGLARAQGDVIAYLDSDNHWEADHLLYAVGGLLAVPGAQSAYTAICRHNLTQGWSDVLFRCFDRTRLEEANFIDLNSFVHRRALVETLGGFDTALTRLVDWDLILRYTATIEPIALPVITGHHVVDSLGLDNITTREALGPNLAHICAKRGSTAEVQ